MVKIRLVSHKLPGQPYNRPGRAGTVSHYLGQLSKLTFETLLLQQARWSSGKAAGWVRQRQSSIPRYTFSRLTKVHGRPQTPGHNFFWKPAVMCKGLLADLGYQTWAGSVGNTSQSS